MTDSGFNSSPTLNQRIVLDRTGLYPVELGFIPISTEVEWLQYFGVSNSLYWVTGDRLCEWALKWLDAWGSDAIIEIKQSPRRSLESVFHPCPLPDGWTDRQLLTLEQRLSKFPRSNPIAYFLADISNSDSQIWIKSPSLENLAVWLTTQVPIEYHPLEQVWQQRQAEASILSDYYLKSDKQELLKRWIGIAQPQPLDLGDYPLPIPDTIAADFDRFWEMKIIHTNGTILDSLSPDQFGIERISNKAHKLLCNRIELISKSRLAKLNLNSQQRNELLAKLPPEIPVPLAINADYKTAFDWAVNFYLPFRKWETAIKKLPLGQRQSDSLADSFEAWIFKYYPSLKVTPVAESQLNYSVAALVQSLYEKFPVLWIVVDGLGWLDHLELLQYLTDTKELTIETGISPRFSILPTKTEYAKWSLYAQLTANASDWNPNLDKVFTKMGAGERYTDSKRDTQLYPALKQGKHQLYCWDTEQLDELYHSGRNWESLYEVERPNILKNLAAQIKYSIKLHPTPELLKVVIASDHGQMMGEVTQLESYPPELEAKGRMAIGKTEDPRFIFLDKNRFGLPHDISVVKSTFYLGSFHKTISGEALGTHGGLFPEEVVVGVSVLSTVVTRSPVLVTCQGHGKASQSGEIEITIDNSNNSVPLTSLCLYINEIFLLQKGYSDLRSVPAHERVSYKIEITSFPELPPDFQGNTLNLTGELRFCFADTDKVKAVLDANSSIAIQQMFSSGFKSDIFSDW